MEQSEPRFPLNRQDVYHRSIHQTLIHMKSRYRKFFGALPVTVFISASLPIASQAGIIGVNAAGNAQPAVLDNGPNTIVANGGTSATPLVNIIAGIVMQGDIAQTAVLDISAPNYTVTNAGKLIGTNHTGISSTFGFNLTNYSIGNITGTNIGLRISDDSIVNNYGTIYGKVGIDVETGPSAAFTLISTGWITGTAGMAIDGGSGTDTISLYDGSRINGGIDLSAGADAINMSTDGFYYVDPQWGHVSTVSCVVNGNIDGGTGIDTLTFGRGKIIPVSPFSGFNPDSSANEVRGDVINMEDIIKNGSGVASIGEVGGPLRTVRTEAIHVNSGGLYINGNLDGTQANQTTITTDGAQLGGTGTWDANITLNGASNIGLAPLSSTTSDNRLILGVVNFVANQINPILIENFSKLRKINSDQDWELVIQHDYSQFGATDNQVAAGRMLNGLVSYATGDIADLLAALDYSDAQTTINTLSALDPSAYLSTVAGLTTQNYHLNRAVDAHNAAIRADSRSVAMPTGVTPAKGDAQATLAAAACNGRSNVWGGLSYDWQDLGNSSRGFDQTGDTASFTAGIDYNIAENLRLGLVAEGSKTSWRGDSSLDS